MSSKTGQAICAGINRHITHPTGRARSNAIAHSGRYVALNPAEIECFMSLQLALLQIVGGDKLIIPFC